MKTILFDLDGTLTDPALGITNSVQHALHYYGINEEYTNLLKFIGPPLIDSFMEYYGFDLEQAKQAVIYYREHFSTHGLFENKVYPGIPKLLQQLKDQGYQLAVATSKPEEFSIRILDHFDLSQYFIGIYGATLDSSRSSKGDVITYALDCLNIKNLDDVIMVGDRMHDVIGAHQNKIKVIGVLYGYGSHKEMENNHADWIVKNIKELYSTIQQIEKDR